MNQPHRLAHPGDNQYSIFRLPEALTCWPAMAVMGATYFGAALLFALGAMLARVSMLFPILLGVVAFMLAIAGTSGAGVCLTDLARKRPYRSVVSYCLAGLLSLPKLLGAGLLMLLAYGAVLLGVALVLLVCKLPGLGPMLLVVAVPVLVLTVALGLVGYYVATSIVGPAIWDGERVLHALSITWSITRNHPFAAVGKIIGGMLLSGIFAALLFGLIAIASTVVGVMAAPIVGVGMQFDMGALMGGYGNNALVGAGIGYALVFVIGAAFVFLLPLMVGVLTWCEFSERVDLGRIRNTTDQRMSDVNAKVTEMREQARQSASTSTHMPASTPPAPSAFAFATAPGGVPAAAAAAAIPAVATNPVATAVTPTPTTAFFTAASPNIVTSPAAATAHCSHCAAQVQPDDKFCEHCGHRQF